MQSTVAFGNSGALHCTESSSRTISTTAILLSPRQNQVQPSPFPAHSLQAYYLYFCGGGCIFDFGVMQAFPQLLDVTVNYIDIDLERLSMPKIRSTPEAMMEDITTPFYLYLEYVYT